MERTITSIEIVKNSGLKITDQGLRKPGKRSKVTSKKVETIHADPNSSFSRKFNRLRGWLVISTGCGAFVDALKTEKALALVKKGSEEELESLIKNYAANKITMEKLIMKWEGDQLTGVTISGRFVNAYGDGATITTPNITMTGAYEYGDRLARDVYSVVEEARSYLAGDYTEIAEEELPELTDEGDKEEGSGNDDEEEGVKPLRKVA